MSLIAMKESEMSGVSLLVLIQPSNAIEHNLKTVPGSTGEIFISIWYPVLKKNLRYKAIQRIVNVLGDDTIQKEMQIEECLWNKFRHTSITSCDVERSFCAHKLIFTNKHH